MSSQEDSKIKYEELKNNVFKQNTCWTWRPTSSPLKTAIIFCVFGIIFFAIGISVLLISRKATERVIPYSGSASYIPDVHITFLHEIQPPIYIYYEITEMHQNYRRFSYSKSNDQLHGIYKNEKDAVGTCYPIYTESERLGIFYSIFFK